MNEESKFDRLPDFSQLLEHAPKLFCMVYRTSALAILLVIAIQHPENGALILERVTDEIIEPLDGFAQILRKSIRNDKRADYCRLNRL